MSGGGGGGGGHKSCLGEVLIHVLGVGLGNDISNVQGVCVCVCVCVCYKSCPGGGECVNGIKHVLRELQIISWV